MAVRSSLVAKVIKERKEKLIAAARSSGLNIPPSPSVHSSDPGSDAPLAVSLGGAHEQVPLPEVQSHARGPDPLPLDNPPPILTIEAGTASDPQGKGKGKSKKHKNRSRSGSKSKSKSSGGSKQKKKKARIEKEQPSEEEISAALHEITLRQKKLNEAREQTRVETSRPQREFSGTRVIPSWNISPESSIMKTRTGEDSLELYQACILPHDQFALGAMPDTRLEDIAAHDLMRAMLWFIYTGILKEEEQKAVSYSGSFMPNSFMAKMLAAADQFELKKLKKLCESHISEKLSGESVAYLLHLADLNHATELKVACLRFAAENQDAVLESDGYEYLKQNCPSLFLELAYKENPSSSGGERQREFSRKEPCTVHCILRYFSSRVGQYRGSGHKSSLR